MQRLGLSLKTVRNHVSNILSELQALQTMNDWGMAHIEHLNELYGEEQSKEDPTTKDALG